jgi:hypothetical protein
MQTSLTSSSDQQKMDKLEAQMDHILAAKESR